MGREIVGSGSRRFDWCRESQVARTGILTYQWRMGLGDVYRHVERREDAAVQYEAAIQAAPADVLKRQAQEKLAAVRPPA